MFGGAMNIGDVVVCRGPSMNPRGGATQVGDIGLVVKVKTKYCTFIGIAFGETQDDLMLYLDDDTMDEKWEVIGEL